MARKPRNESQSTEDVGMPEPFIPSAKPVRTPDPWRVVTARSIKIPGRRSRRRIPEIRLSGEWLARIGFPQGTRYLLSADVEGGHLILSRAVRQHVTAPRKR